ncbi:MAG: 30S ribosomal protein S1 [Flammeovirgaceae bacterium]|nr:30S ribosomal protein S1 [Flammeovirgaceae bacterium]
MPKKEEKDQKEIVKRAKKAVAINKVKTVKTKEEKVEAKVTPKTKSATKTKTKSVTKTKPVTKTKAAVKKTESANEDKKKAKIKKVTPKKVEKVQKASQASKSTAKPTKKEPAAKASKTEEKELASSKRVLDLATQEAPKKKDIKIKKSESVQQTWEEFENENKSEYSDKERADLESLYGETVNTITEKQVIEGYVVALTNREVIVNIGFKSDGIVSRSEFRDVDELKPGDKVEVYIEEQENAIGQLVLSRRKAKIVKAWDNIQEALDKDIIIDGMVKRRTKGGLIVDVYGVEAFLPGSQIDVKPIRDFDIFVGKKMEVKVVKINYSNDNVVVSHKLLIEKDLEKQKIEILSNLEKGQVLEGIIKNMTNFGVFIDLGGVDGLLHITDISWGRINHPEDVLTLDQKVNVVVLDFDDEKKRISLGMKQLTPHPWDSLSADIEVGSKISGKIVNVADYGSFLEIIPGVEGLIHVSEMSWSQHLRNPQDFMKIGDEKDAIVLTIDRNERKMSLGIKQLSEDPWTKQDALVKYAVGTQHKGIVRNLTNFGLFIELEEGIDGLVHVSDLSWTKKVKHPSEFVKINDELEVIVMELDTTNRKLALSHKHLEDNPWDNFESVFTRDSIHKCTILSKGERNVILELPYGLEGTCNSRNLTKEDGSEGTEGETLDFRVIEFSKDDKRVILTHTGSWKEGDHVSNERSKPKSTKGKKTVKKKVDSSNSTLGDIEALSSLKEKMEDGVKAEIKKAVVKRTASKKAKSEDKEL